MNERLKLLLDAYVKVCQCWGSMAPGESKGRMYAAGRFLEKMIKQELKPEVVRVDGMATSLTWKEWNELIMKAHRGETK